MKLDTYWYSHNIVSLLLTPLSWLFSLVVFFRRLGYRIGLFKTYRLPVPVIIVGNITVGGTGKTPMVAWIALFLKNAGYSPGVISRGYGGKASTWPQQVRSDSDPKVVGDEAVLIARHSQCPMAVGPNRVAAAKSLLDHAHCDIIISDDGLQHYALGRDIEIVMVDGIRRFGNARLLPAGPLRESKRRLGEIDFLIANSLAGPGEWLMKLVGQQAVNLQDPTIVRDLNQFQGEEVHAVAGIGYPARFFNELHKFGLSISEHPFPDHFPFTMEDINFHDEKPVIMTEKDAVKCMPAPGPNYWYIPVSAQMDNKFGQKLLDLLKRKGHGQKTN